MADPEQSDKNSTHHPRKNYYHQNRGATSSRGRGRNNLGVNKALHLFGVRDLREFLDMKHQDQNEAQGGPPPDPSYNYLKDPSRDNTAEQTHKYHKDQYVGKGHTFRGSHRGRGRGDKFIQNPVNIKVELVASTGERNCKIDEETKLADIKRVPNYVHKDLRQARSEEEAARSHERPRNERGRGRWQRRGRGRGRGAPRGRAKPEPNLNTEKNETSTDNCDEVGVSSTAGASNEETSEENVYSENVEAEEDYVEYNDECLEVVGGMEKEDEAEFAIKDNLVVTSSQSQEPPKRSVKFKLEDEGDSQGSREESESVTEKRSEAPNVANAEKNEALDDGKKI